MLCHGRSTGLRLAPGTTLVVEGANTAANDHEIAMDVVPAARCLVILFPFVFVPPCWGRGPRLCTNKSTVAAW